MWSRLSRVSKITLTAMGAITAILGFLTLDQLNNPPVFSPSANLVQNDAGQTILEIELAARGDFALRDSRISFFLADQNGRRIAMNETAPNERDHFAPVDMLVAANQSKFGLISSSDLISAEVSEVAMIYLCATVRGRIQGSFHQQSYVLSQRNGSFFQEEQDSAIGILARPRCAQLGPDSFDFPFPEEPSDFS